MRGTETITKEESMSNQLGFHFDDSLNPPPEKPVEETPDKKEILIEDWHEPTGVREVKRGSKIFIRGLSTWK